MNVKELYRRGFIPGPDETEKTFYSRVDRYAEPKEMYIVDYFGVTLDWVPIRVGKTSFFEAAFATFDKGVQITLSKKLPSYIDFGEVLSHELVHTLRCGFHTSKYEEVLAYMTSKWSMRQIVGPACSETWVLWGTFSAFALSFSALVQEAISPALFSCGTCLPLLCSILLSVHKRYKLALARKFYQKRYALYSDALLLHLTDEEIITPTIKNDSLRWEQINEVYRLKTAKGNASMSACLSTTGAGSPPISSASVTE